MRQDSRTGAVSAVVSPAVRFSFFQLQPSNAGVSALVARRVDDALKTAVGAVVRGEAGKSIYERCSSAVPSALAGKITCETVTNLQSCEARARTSVQEKLQAKISEDFSEQFGVVFSEEFFNSFPLSPLAFSAVHEMLKNGSSRGEWKSEFVGAVRESVGALVGDRELAELVFTSLCPAVDSDALVAELRSFYVEKQRALVNSFASEFERAVSRAVSEGAFEILQGISAPKIESGLADALLEGQRNNELAEQKAREVCGALRFPELSVELVKIASVESFKAVQARAEVAEAALPEVQEQPIELTRRVQPRGAPRVVDAFSDEGRSAGVEADLSAGGFVTRDGKRVGVPASVGARVDIPVGVTSLVVREPAGVSSAGLLPRVPSSKVGVAPVVERGALDGVGVSSGGVRDTVPAFERDGASVGWDNVHDGSFFSVGTLAGGYGASSGNVELSDAFKLKLHDVVSSVFGAGQGVLDVIRSAKKRSLPNSKFDVIATNALSRALDDVLRQVVSSGEFAGAVRSGSGAAKKNPAQFAELVVAELKGIVGAELIIQIGRSNENFSYISQSHELTPTWVELERKVGEAVGKVQG